MNGITLFENELDHKLGRAYAQYEKVHEDFKKHFRRTPECGVFIGTFGDNKAQKSSVSVRWTNSAGEADARAIYRFYSEGAF